MRYIRIKCALTSIDLFHRKNLFFCCCAEWNVHFTWVKFKEIFIFFTFTLVKATFLWYPENGLNKKFALWPFICIHIKHKFEKGGGLIKSTVRPRDTFYKICASSSSFSCSELNHKIWKRWWLESSVTFSVKVVALHPLLILWFILIWLYTCMLKENGILHWEIILVNSKMKLRVFLSRLLSVGVPKTMPVSSQTAALCVKFEVLPSITETTSN